jgi:hypothetical protein
VFVNIKSNVKIITIIIIIIIIIINFYEPAPPPPPTCFEVLVGLGLSNDPESYSGGSVASGKALMPDMSKVVTQIKRNTLVFQVGVWADNPTPNKICAVEKFLKFKKTKGSSKDSNVERRIRKRRRNVYHGKWQYLYCNCNHRTAEHYIL